MQIAQKIEGKSLLNFRQTLVHLLKSEGWRGMTKGFSLNIIKGPIALSISLTTYDLMRDYIQSLGDIEEDTNQIINREKIEKEDFE